MRSFVLFGLFGLALASCDSPYGKIPDSPSAGSSIATGSHLRASPDAPSNVQSTSGESLNSSQGPINNLHGK
jgi:hypothetical protein